MCLDPRVGSDSTWGLRKTDHGKRTLQSFAAIFQHTKGSPGSWQAALFFVYSGKIAFSPIRSRGVSRSQPPELQRMGFCSPKSAFVLAEKVCVIMPAMLEYNAKQLGKLALQNLQDRARLDIMRQVTAENVMTEYFSKFVNSCVCLFHAVSPSFTPLCSVATHRCFRPSTTSCGRSVMQKRTRWSGRGS